MIKGLAHFTKHFAGSADDFVVVGGVAAHEIMGSEGLTFRATKDIDLVIVARPATACHAAFRTTSGRIADDLGMHRTGVASGRRGRAWLLGSVRSDGRRSFGDRVRR